MEGVSPELARAVKAKQERRKRLSALPWPEKVAMVVKLQEMAEPVLKARDPRARAWQLPEA